MYEKLVNDWFAVGHKDLKKSTDMLWDMIFNNIEYCGFYRLAYNQYHWCMNNYNECNYGTGLADNLWDNSFSIISSIYKLYEVISADDRCYSDEQTLGEIGSIVEELFRILGSAQGFDEKWD